MRREAPRVSFLMCPFCVGAPSSDLATTSLDDLRHRAQSRNVRTHLPDGAVFVAES
jgi:hypothetical protein